MDDKKDILFEILDSFHELGLLVLPPLPDRRALYIVPVATIDPIKRRFQEDKGFDTEDKIREFYDLVIGHPSTFIMPIPDMYDPETGITPEGSEKFQDWIRDHIKEITKGLPVDLSDVSSILGIASDPFSMN